MCNQATRPLLHRTFISIRYITTTMHFGISLCTKLSFMQLVVDYTKYYDGPKKVSNEKQFVIQRNNLSTQFPGSAVKM